MKILYSALKIAVISFLIYKCLINSFLFLVAGMWIIPFLLLILFAYLCKSFLGEAFFLATQFKSFPQFSWKVKLPKFHFRQKISKQLASETV